MPDTWIVIENTPGYLPEDDEPPTFIEYADAVAYLNDRCREYEEDPDGNYSVEYGLASSGNYAAAVITDHGRIHDLGRWIAVERLEREEYEGSEPRSTGIAGYVYRADTYCPDCTLRMVLADMGLEGHGLSYIPSEAIDRLGISSLGGAVYRGGEHGWDSDTFPKVILRPHGEQLECGKCGCSL